MAKAAFNKIKTFHQQNGLEFTKPVSSYIWSIALQGAEIWTLLKTDQKYSNIEQDAHVTVYFIGRLLYMFRVSSPPIFRSTKQL
jgi:hypothetical protein